MDFGGIVAGVFSLQRGSDELGQGFLVHGLAHILCEQLLKLGLDGCLEGQHGVALGLLGAERGAFPIAGHILLGFFPQGVGFGACFAQNVLRLLFRVSQDGVGLLGCLLNSLGAN